MCASEIALQEAKNKDFDWIYLITIAGFGDQGN
jgi:hypothetical protein